MNSILHISLTLTLVVFCQATYGQLTLSGNSPLLGKWVGRDTAIYISTEYMSELYKADNEWKHSTFANHQFYFIDAKAEKADKTVELWMAARYTSHRDYRIDGTESSIETVDYRACRIEFINKGIVQIHFTKTYSVNEPNKIPEIKLPDEMKNDLAAKKYSSTITLTRLVE